MTFFNGILTSGIKICFFQRENEFYLLTDWGVLKFKDFQKALKVFNRF